MALARWAPFGEMTRFRDEMDRLFDRFLEPSAGTLPSLSTSWAPSVDVFDRDGDLVVEAELPGVKKEDVEVTVDDDVVTIRGEMKKEQETKDQGIYRRERRFGEFVRSIALPQSVKGDQAKAKFDNGVLEITLPKAAEERHGQKVAVS